LKGAGDLAFPGCRLELLDAAFLSRPGKELPGRRVGHLAQQFAPASSLVHPLADQRRIQNRAIKNHR
jgi:hypothetical protein